jgi:hypothetical protein
MFSRMMDQSKWSKRCNETEPRGASDFSESMHLHWSFLTNHRCSPTPTNIERGIVLERREGGGEGTRSQEGTLTDCFADAGSFTHFAVIGLDRGGVRVI